MPHHASARLATPRASPCLAAPRHTSPVDVATLCPVGVSGSALSNDHLGRASAYCHDGGTSSYCMSWWELAPYLQLYFAPAEISHVRVYNHVYGGGHGIGAHSIAYRDASTGSWVRCAYEVWPNEAGPFVILCAGMADGVQVRLEDRGSEDYLILAEVEVYSPSCPPSAPPSPPAPPPVDVATLCPVVINGSALSSVKDGRVSTRCHDGGTSSFCRSDLSLVPYLQLY